MNNSPESWKTINTEDVILNKQLSKLKKNDLENFKTTPKVIESEYKEFLGAGPGRFNVHTVSGVAGSFARHLQQQETSHKVLIGFDESENSNIYVEAAIETLNNLNVDVFTFSRDDHHTFKDFMDEMYSNNYAGAIHISGGKSSELWSSMQLFGNDCLPLIPTKCETINVMLETVDFLAWKNNRSGNGDFACVKPKVILSNSPIVENSSLKVSGYARNFKVFDALNINRSNLFFLDKNKGGKQTWPTENERALTKPIALAKKTKSDIAFACDSRGEKLAVSVKYKKRFKYITGNKLSALALEYELGRLTPEEKSSKYIVITKTAGGMAKRIALKNKVEIIEVDPGFNNILKYISGRGEQDLLLAYDENFNFISGGSKYQSASGTAKIVIKMAERAKQSGTDLYREYKRLEEIYGVFIFSKSKKMVVKSNAKKVLRKIVKLKALGNRKVVSVRDFKEGANGLVAVDFEDDSSITVLFDEVEGLKMFAEAVGAPGTDRLKLYPFKREFEEWVNENTEEFEDKKFTKKGFLKYSIFSVISVSILVFVFMFIYKTINTNGNNTSLTQIATWWADSTPSRWLWLLYWAWKVCTLFISAWMKKRMFSRLGEKVSTKHLMISAVMGSVIAFVTPFAVGGDAIGYWYLRRKKVKRSILAATLASSTLWGETKFALQTIILVWVGWPVYQAIFNTGDPQAHAALIWFFIGLVWTVFSSAMIFMLTASQGVQEFIVKYTVMLLEWMPIVHVHDLESKESNVQYEFYLIRSSMKKIWNKWWFVLEMMFYDLIPLFFSPILILWICSGTINPMAPSGQYWTPIVIGDITGTANSMSITPGGSGTSEWLNVVTRNVQFANTPLTKLPYNLSPEQITAGQDLFYKMYFAWPMLAVSAFIIFIVILTNRKTRTTKISNKYLGVLLSSLLFIAISTYLILIMVGVIL